MTPAPGDRAVLIAELTAAARAYQRSVDALDELASRLMGVNRTDARVLDLLEERGHMTAGEIAAAAGLTSGAVTGVVDRLERAGYARRAADERDRRRVVVEPTPKIVEAAQAIYEGIGAKGEAMLGAYSDDELALVTRFLRDAEALTDAHAAELREQHAAAL